MPLVPAKCPSCGGEIQVDNSRKEAFCSYCGNKFLVESAVNYYNTKNEYHIEHADIKMEDSKGLEAKLKNAESYLVQHKDYAKAEMLFKAITYEFAGDWRGWWGVARVKTHEFTGISTAEIRTTSSDIEQKMREAFSKSLADVGQYVQKALNVADAEKKKELQNDWESYQRRCKEAVDSYLSRHMDEWRENNRQAVRLKSDIDAKEKQHQRNYKHHSSDTRDLFDICLGATCRFLARIGIFVIILSLIFHWHNVLIIGIIAQAGWLYDLISKSADHSKTQKLEAETSQINEMLRKYNDLKFITFGGCFRGFEQGLEG